jgi:hypothetical protein
MGSSSFGTSPARHLPRIISPEGGSRFEDERRGCAATRAKASVDVISQWSPEDIFIAKAAQADF